MNKRKMSMILALVAILVMACSCPVTNIFNSLLGKTQPEDIIDLVPDQIMENIPDAGELLEAIPDALPTEAQGLLEEIPSVVEGTGLSGLLDEEVPENIPLVPDRNDDLMALMGTISYTAPAPLLEVYDFYRTEMAKMGWEINEDMSSIDGEQKNATLTFVNDTQDCWVSLYVSGSDTGVAVFVTDK